jgi:hypothetical protein
MSDETWKIKKGTVYAAIIAIESGLEYARECLADHDTALGRTTYKNRNVAETIEGDIEQMEHALDLLPASNPNNEASK